MPPSEELRREFDYTLTSAFEYAHKGQMREAQFVRLTAPTSKHRNECAVLKQAFFRALKDAPSASEEAKAAAKERKQADSDIKGEDVMDMIYMSQADMGVVLEASRKLLGGGVAQVDGEEKLTSALIDLMALEDLERLTGDYLAFFTLRSALKRLSDS